MRNLAKNQFGKKTKLEKIQSKHTNDMEGAKSQFESSKKLMKEKHSNEISLKDEEIAKLEGTLEALRRDLASAQTNSSSTQSELQKQVENLRTEKAHIINEMREMSMKLKKEHEEKIGELKSV